MKKLIKTSYNLAIVLVMLMSFSAEASHYRYGSISWRKVNNSTNTVEFKVVTAWRRWANQSVGSVVSLGSLSFGDGTSAPIRATVTSAQGNSSTGWFFSEALITKTYNSNGNYIASFSSCCRIGYPLINNSNGNMRNETIVNIGNDNNSPVSTVPPIVSLSVGQAAATFKMPVLDPDGDNLTFRLATCSEVLRAGQNCNPNPSGLSVSSNGTITFNTVGKTVGQLYSVMVVAEDGQSKVINDFMFQMVAPSTPPQFDYSTTPADGYVYQVAPGEAVNFNVKAFDVDPGSSVSLSGVGLPIGSSFNPGATGNPTTGTFSWTPSTSQLGTSVMNFTAQDNNGVQSQTAVSVIVSMDPVFDVPPTPASGVHNVVAPGNTISFDVQVSDPDPTDLVHIYDVTGKGMNGNAVPLYAGASLSPFPTTPGNPTTATFTWTPSPSQWGHRHVFFNAKDTYGGTTKHEVAILVNNNPEFTSTPVTSVEIGQTYTYNVVSTDTDIPFGDALQLFLTNGPSWLTLTDNGDGTGTLSGTPGLNDVGSSVVTIESQDINHHQNVGGIPTQTFALEVLAPDNDKDGIPDAVDLDDDNDGILDGAECTNSNFFWSNAPQVTGTNTAVGTINGIGYTYSSSKRVYTTPTIFAHGVFPVSYGIPNQTAIRNIETSRNTLTFAQPMTNPVLVFSSIGQGGIAVPIQFETPVQVLWSTATTIDSPTRITGREGYAIVRLNGTFSSISFDYLANENYVNFSFGADFFSTCDTDGDGIVDQFDLDSDNDGCPDAIEAGHQDLDNDGVLGNSPVTVDANGLVLSQGGYTGSNNVVVDANLNGCNEAPVAVCKNITLNADANCSAVITAADVDGGSSDPDGDELTYSIDNLGPFTVGTHTVTLTVTDPAGESDACTATVTVEDVTAPVLVGVPANETVSCDAVPALANVTSTDNCSSTVTVNEIVSPVDAPINGLTGYWSFNEGTGNTSADLSGNGSTAYLSSGVTWTEGHDGNAVAFPGTGNNYVEIPNNAGGALDAQYSLSMFASYKPSTSGNQMPIIQYNPNNWGCHLWDIGNGNLFVRITHRNLAFTTSIAAPVLTPGEWQCVGATYDYNSGLVKLWRNGVKVAERYIGRVHLSTQYPVRIGSVNFDGRRKNGAVDEVRLYDRALTEAEIKNLCPDCPQHYFITRTWTATDAIGNATSATQKIEVIDNAAPVITVPADITVNTDAGICGAAVDFEATATDNCGDVTLSYSAVSGTLFNLGTTAVTVTAEDECGNISSASFNVTVEDNEAPVALAQDLTVQLDANGNASITANEVNNGSNDACGVASLSVAPNVFNCANVGNNTVTLTVTDVNGNVSTVDANVTVEDNVAPVAVAQNVTIQLDENGNASVTAGQVNNGSSDACGIASIALDKVSFDCSNFGDNTVELTAVDVNGNSSTVNATVTVVDEIVPTITCPSDIHVVADRGDCDPVITWSAPVANDNCSFSVVSNYESGEEFPVGSYEVVYTVTDIAENNAYCSFNVTVEAEPLVITNAVISEYVGGNNVSCFGSTDGSIGITVEGGCLPYTYEWNSANSSANDSNLGAGTHTVTVTDANGTTTNATYVLTEPSLLETEISENQTVYFGYADSACADIAVSTIGGIAPYNVNWSTGSTATAINVCPETSTDYSANVTDANGCATHSVSKICVIDVIDHDHAEQSSKGKGKGPKTPKILICHKNGKTLSITINAVAAHLAHGDLLGDCDAERACHSTSGKRAVEHNHSNEVEIDNQTVIMEVYPNPTSSNATVSVSFEQEGEYTIAVFNMIGEKVQDLYSGDAIEGDIQDYKINASALKSGIYFINAYTSNGVIASQKLIVTK